MPIVEPMLQEGGERHDGELPEGTAGGRDAAAVLERFPAGWRLVAEVARLPFLVWPRKSGDFRYEVWSIRV